MLDLVGIVAPFFMVIMLGFLAGRLGVFRLESAKVFNNYLLYFALPAMFLSKLLQQDVLRKLRKQQQEKHAKKQIKKQRL